MGHVACVAAQASTTCRHLLSETERKFHWAKLGFHDSIFFIASRSICSSTRSYGLLAAALGRVGISAAYLPDYRGSNEYCTYLFPIPYFVYRGERLQVDRRGARGELFEGDYVSLDFSANLGSLA